MIGFNYCLLAAALFRKSVAPKARWPNVDIV